MARIEQAFYYSKCVLIVLKEIYSTNPKTVDIQNEDEGIGEKNSKNVQKFDQLSILIKKEGSFKKWILSKVELAS
jgi:hypothetical protein